MISDAEAVAAIPQKGWLYTYLRHALVQTTSPAVYHVGVGLGVLASCAHPALLHRYAGDLHGNLYTLVVGRSGEDQKSTAVNIGRRILYEAEPKLLGRDPGSPEGLIDMLADRPRVTLRYSEFGKFLAQAQRKGGYFEPMKALLTDLWDCLSTDTEVLTPDGWASWEDCVSGRTKRCMAYDEATRTLQTVDIDEARIRPVRPEEGMVVYQGARVDLRLSPGHRILAWTDREAPWRREGHWTTAGDLADRRRRLRLPVSAPPAETVPSPLTAAQLTLVGFFRGRKGRIHGSRLTPQAAPVFHTGDDMYLATLRTVLQAAGVRFHVEPQPEGYRVTLVPGSLPKGLNELLCPSICALRALRQLPLGHFRVLWDAVLCAGGDCSGGPGQRQGSYRCTREEGDTWQWLACMVGLHPSMQVEPDRKDRVRIRITAAEHITLGRSRSTRAAFRRVDAAPGEQVWCLTNRLGTLVVRRNGKVAIVGNCTPQSRAKANGKGVDVPEPRLSVLAACSIPYLEKHTNPEDWSGGFMGRWAVLYGQRERTDPDPKGDDTLVPWLAEQVKLRADVTEIGMCQGLNAAASERWRDWFFGLEKRPLPATIAGVRTRAPTIARKAAMLYAYDFGEPFHGQPWHITDEHIYWGIRFAELHLKSVVSLSSRLAEHPEARQRRNILDLVPPGGSSTLAEILRACQMRKRVVCEILDGLVTDGSLSTQMNLGQSGGITYSRPAPR